MITNILLAVSHFITNTISHLGYSGVALLMAIESAAVPLPSEVIMPFSGFLASSGRFTLLGLALAGALGSVIGSWIIYALGFYGGRPLIANYGKYVLISEHDLNLTERFFRKFGSWATFIGRMLPVVRTFISLPAGIGQEPLFSFTVAAFLGSFIWSYILAWLGLKLGEQWNSLEKYFRRFEILIGILLILFIIYWIKRHAKSKRLKS